MKCINRLDLTTIQFFGVLLVGFFCLPQVKAQEIGSIAFASNGPNIASLNWPDGNWHVRVILLDESLLQVGTLVDETVFNQTSSWPSIAVTMLSSAPNNYSLRFYRSQMSFSGGDSNIEFNDVGCSTNNCSNATTTNIALANTLNGGWSPQTVLPIELTSFEVE